MPRRLTERVPQTLSDPKALRLLWSGSGEETHDEERPRTRAECVDGERPCIWASCRHNLALDVDGNGTIAFNPQGGTDPSEMAETCSLDVADRGEHDLSEVGALLGVSGEAARQVEQRALRKYRARLRLLGLADALLGPWAHAEETTPAGPEDG